MALGGYVAVQGFAYRVGGLTRMGPGFLSVALGVMLVLVGVVLLLRAGAAPVVVALPETMLAEDGEPAGAEWRAWGLILFSITMLVRVAFSIGPAEIFTTMLLGLLSGSTMARGSPLKGIAMPLVGLVIGLVGTDVNTGAERFTFGLPELSDRVELVALAFGLFGITEFLRNVNRLHVVGGTSKVRLRDMRPSRAELRQSFWPMMHGTMIGTLFGALPGTRPTITTFIAYAFERRISKTPERFGHGALEGVAAPEAASHSKTQVDSSRP